MPNLRWCKDFAENLTPNVYPDNYFGKDNHRRADCVQIIEMTNEEYDLFQKNGFSWLLNQDKFKCDSPDHYSNGQRKPPNGPKFKAIEKPKANEDASA